MMQSKYTAILLPGFHKEQMDGFLKDKEPAIQLDSNYNEIRNKLDQFRDLLIKDFSLKPVDEDVWSLACKSFFENVRLKNIPYKKPTKQLAQQIMIGEYAENLIKKCVSENENIILSANLSQGQSIHIGKDIVAAELPDKRNFARCEAAIDECLEAGFLKRNHCGYSLTDAGYRYVENVQECVK